MFYSISRKLTPILSKTIARPVLTRNFWPFSKDQAIPTTRRASKICTSLITAHSNEEIAIFDRALQDLIQYTNHPHIVLDEYLDKHPDFVMGNVICAIQSILTGLGDFQKYYTRAEDALSRDPNVKDFTKNEHLYLRVLKALQCHRIRYAINTLEEILMNDPVDVLAINSLSTLYNMLNEDKKMFSSISRTWSYWGIHIPCDAYMNGYRSESMMNLGHYEEAEKTGMQTLSNTPNDCRAIHAVLHSLEGRGRSREGRRFLRETVGAWSNHPVDYIQGSILEHHFMSHQMTLDIQCKNVGYAVTTIDNMILRQRNYLEGKSNADDQGVKQDLLCASHINDYVQVLYRLELLGEGMGDRWDQVYDLFKHTNKTMITPIDRIYQSILFSVTGKGEDLNQILSNPNQQEMDEKWKSFELPESLVKWSHVHNEDRENDLLITPTTSQIINSIVELNNEHYEKAGNQLFDLHDSFSTLGGEERDHELLLLSLYKALSESKKYRVLERLLNDFTTRNAKRADAFYLLSECVKNLGNIKKAETLKDYAYNLGFEQGGDN